jgi:protein-S-isoprenylcysteine O-methyltransferase Ste14
MAAAGRSGGTRSEQEVERLRAERGGVWRVVRGVRRRRPILTALLVLAAPAHTLLTGTRPVDLLTAWGDWRAIAAWALMIAGVAIRIWGSGNLRKNQEITQTGVYAMVGHPLYTGSLAMFLAYFLTVGDPGVGVALFVALVALIYYPTMLGEEEYLGLKFPDQAAARRRLPRLLPDPRRFGEALATDRFSFGAADSNLGLRSLGFLVALPLFIRILILLQR